MDHGSKYLYLSESEGQFDTNIISLKIDPLKNWKSNTSNENPIPCKNCFSVQTPFEKFYNSNQIENELEQNHTVIKPNLITGIEIEAKSPIQKKPKQQNEFESLDFSEDEHTPKAIRFKEPIFVKKTCEESVNQNDSYWICSFCGSANLNNGKNKMKSLDQFFVLKDLTEVYSNEEDITVIFCLDNSGSMSSTIEIPEEANLPQNSHLTQEELEMLSKALPGENLRFSNTEVFGNPQRKKYATRKACLIGAIQKELNKMKTEFPLRKVGVVIFNDEVVVTGDGTVPKKVISGSSLLDYNKCLQTGKESNIMLSQYISQNSHIVIKPYERSPEKGKTALGPALVTAVGLASTGKPGSMVILCTDGLANVGFGDLSLFEEDPNGIEIYDKIGKFANKKGININVITITGEKSGTKVLAKIVEKTNGNIDRINPTIIKDEFNQMLNDKLLGRNGYLTIFLPNHLKFLDEDARNLHSGGSLFKKEIGNISESTKISFRIGKKNYVHQRMKKNLKEGDKIKLQIQLKFLSLEGFQLLRVASSQIPITYEKDKTFLAANVPLLVNHAALDVANWYGILNEIEVLQRQQNWNVLIDYIRESKRNHHQIDEDEEISIVRYKNDASYFEEMTVNYNKRRRDQIGSKKKQNNATKVENDDDEDDREEEKTFAMKLRKKNYKK